MYKRSARMYKAVAANMGWAYSTKYFRCHGEFGTPDLWHPRGVGNSRNLVHWVV